MKSKDEIQKEIINTIVENNCKGIILASVRVGKCRIILETIKKHSLEETPVVFLAYPNIDVKNSWLDECEKINFFPEFIFSTFISLEKVKNTKSSYYIFDEAHALPEENILPIAGEIARNNRNVLFASGTYNSETLGAIKAHTKMKLIVNYSTEEAIKDGIVSDFNIFIHTYNLDATTQYEYGKVKKWKSTEKKECNRLSNRILQSYGEEKKWAALNRMRFINSSNSMINYVNNWIRNNKEKRFILFSSDENTGMKYSLPMFNSKSKDDEILKQFQNEEINQLCLIKKGSAGVTYKNLDTILITAINSNGENLFQQIGRSLLTDTETSNIHIFVSSEEFQLKWLTKSLVGINKDKIKFV